MNHSTRPSVKLALALILVLVLPFVLAAAPNPQTPADAMGQATWVAILAVVAIGLSVVAAGAAFYSKLKREQQGYPIEADIEAALLPVIFQGICSAYKLSEQALDEVQLRLEGDDKKKIADSIYAMLPDQVDGYDLTLIKRLVPPERFEQLVQDGFDRFDRFFVEHRAHFNSLFEAWKAENA